MGKLACVFPGQGSQSVGMAADLYEKFSVAKETFAQIDATAGRSLSELCFKGPEEELKRTINTQPTILAASLAAWACYIAQRGPRPDFVAGHSLGEFTALVAAGALQLPDAVKVVQERASLMENCAKGAMSAVLGLSAEKLEGLCAQANCSLEDANNEDNVVIVANFNTREQLVISGSPEAVQKAGELAKTAGGKVIPLPVGGAFHSPLMVPAAEQFAKNLSSIQLVQPQCPIVQNIDAQPSLDVTKIKEKLSGQMASAVRWYETVEYMIAQGVDTFIEIGPGKVLAGTIKKIDKSVKIFNVFDAASLEATLSQCQTAVQA